MDAPKENQNPQADLVGYSFSRESLAKMSASELAEALDHVLGDATEETYDGELIAAILEELEKKAPAARAMGANEAYECFEEQMRSLAEDEEKTDIHSSSPRRVVNVLRIGLIAVLSILVAMSLMIAAQAVGIDVFGEVARWTEKVFSFGELRDDSVKEQTVDGISKSSDNISRTKINGSRSGAQYKTLQEALDACGITEVVEPKLPNGYEFTRVELIYQDTPACISIIALAQSENGLLTFQIRNRDSSSQTRIEKRNTDVTIQNISDTTVYLLENFNNFSLAWETDSFEYYIGTSQEMDPLIDMANDMIR